MGFVSKFIKALFGSKPEPMPTRLVTGMHLEIEAYRNEVDLIVSAYGLPYNLPEVEDALQNAEHYVATSWEHPSGQNEAIMRLLGANPYICVTRRDGEKYILQRRTCTLSATSIIEYFRHSQRLGINRIENTVHGILFFEDDTSWIKYVTSPSDGSVSKVMRTIIEHFTGGQCTTNPAEPLHAGFPDVYVKEPVPGADGGFRWKQLARVDG